MASQQQPADSGKKTGVPRLNIATVLLWTTVTAGLLALHYPIDLVPSDFRGLFAVNQVVHCFFGGAGILAFLLLLRSRKKSVEFPTAIGHWFLFTHASATILAIGWYLWVERLASGRGIQFYIAVVSLIPAIILVCAMRSQSLPFIWKATVVAMILLDLAMAVQVFAMLSLWIRIGNLVVAALALTAATYDVMSEETYDWLHWVGVASLLASQTMQELFNWLA